MSSHKYNQEQIDAGNVTGEILSPLVRFWQKEHALAADGKLGPETIKSLTIEPDTVPNIKLWKSFEGPLQYLPRNRADVYKIFGNPSSGTKVDRKWFKENIRTFRKDMALPGVDPHRYVKIHKLAEPYIREALLRATSVSNYPIKKFACFNYRLMRSRNRLSYHSWGIAFDINPEDNRAIRYRHAGDKPAPWSDEWHALRPNGMPKEFVEAIKSVGFSWGGDWNTFADDMHFELVL